MFLAWVGFGNARQLESELIDECQDGSALPSAAGGLLLSGALTSELSQGPLLHFYKLTFTSIVRGEGSTKVYEPIYVLRQRMCTAASCSLVSTTHISAGTARQIST